MKGAEYVWQMHWVEASNPSRLSELLMDGWEPFAVIPGVASVEIFLRRLWKKNPEPKK